MLDEGDERIVALVVPILRRHGWDARVEVTYSEWGERGSYDVLAWHPAARVLLVVEVKTELPSVEGTLRPMDVKVRLARKVAGNRFGWQPLIVGRVLVLPEDRTARRPVDRHATVLRAALPADSRLFRSWLRAPSMPIGAIWFLSDSSRPGSQRNPSSVHRVRRPRATTS